MSCLISPPALGYQRDLAVLPAISRCRGRPEKVIIGGNSTKSGEMSDSHCLRRSGSALGKLMKSASRKNGTARLARKITPDLDSDLASIVENNAARGTAIVQRKKTERRRGRPYNPRAHRLQ